MRFIISIYMVLLIVCSVNAYEYSWQIDETPEGQESASVNQPVVVQILDQPIVVADGSAAIALLKHYSVVLDESWTHAQAARLLKTFDSIPQTKNSLGAKEPHLPTSVWTLTDQHIHNDIEIEHHGDVRKITLAADAFVYATPLIAEIEGVRGRYFSKGLHRAIVRYITENGMDYNATRRILQERYDVSIDIPDYTELTRHTTGEDAGRFSQFKPEELIVLISMFEELPSGMLKTPGLNYLVRRLDGTPHPRYPNAPAVAWTGAGYIEFMETAFTGDLGHTQRLVLHEKAHFLWDHLFDEQLRQDWIEVGGWYENPDDVDGWSTTKQTEFVSAYAHGINPNEDMAESISFYIVNPDKLRSRSPSKYEFIQNRIMHGTRYISQIREDLTFEVYNLYPDYVYPGRIVRVNISVEGEPTEDKLLNVEIEIYGENELDTSRGSPLRIFSEKGTYFDMHVRPINNANNIGHILRGQAIVSKYAAGGYWSPDQIKLRDANGNKRLSGTSDYGWQLYIDNPLADCEPPQYIPNSMKLALSKRHTQDNRPYYVVTATWKANDNSGVVRVYAALNDTFIGTYSRFGYGPYNDQTQTATVDFIFPEYMPNGIYSINRIGMYDKARNRNEIYFTESELDEQPQQINVPTTKPDFTPPDLNVNNIIISAEPTIPDAPNGETIVDIKFQVKDDNSGYNLGFMILRDPQGIESGYHHKPKSRGYIYYPGDPTVYAEESSRIVLPVGSAPGTWGLAEMHIYDKAGNRADYDFTEIVRFEVDDTQAETTITGDLNGDGVVNILDLVIVVNAFDSGDPTADVNADGDVNVLDLVMVASEFQRE